MIACVCLDELDDLIKSSRKMCVSPHNPKIIRGFNLIP